MWSEIYENLRKCRLSVVCVYPAEYLTIPVCGEPDIAKNFISVKQDWCRDLQIHQLLEINGKIKDADQMPKDKKPLEMELNELKNAIKEKLARLRVSFW